MDVIFRITLAKIRRGFKKNFIQSVSVFISTFIISFLFCFAVALNNFKTADPTFGIPLQEGGDIAEYVQESEFTIYSIRGYFSDVIMDISFVAVLCAILSLTSIAVCARLRTEENKRFFATLVSVGATRRQRRSVSKLETGITFVLPIILGSFLGIVPSEYVYDRVVDFFLSDYIAFSASLLIPIAISVVGIITVLMFGCAPHFKRRGSVIESIRIRNKDEEGTIHGHRNSKVFKRLPIVNRLAEKNMLFHKRAYSRLSVMYSIVAAYPILAVFFFVLLAQKGVTDYTPLYGIDAVAIANIFTLNIAAFGAVAFLILAVLATIQTVYLVDMQKRVRGESLYIYKSIGMTDESIKKMLKIENSRARCIALLFVAIYTCLLIAFALT